LFCISDVIRHVVQNYQLDINIQRDTDQLTPFQLALEKKNTEMCSLLKELGAEEILTVDVSKLLLDEDRGKSMNTFNISLAFIQ
jgi:ankyrin repeat protein